MKTGLKTIRLQAGRERSLKRFHPWVYSGAIDSIEPGITAGDMVEVLDAAGNFLGCGFYSASSIAIKIFSFKKITPDREFWKARFLRAKNLRDQFNLAPDSEATNAFRLVNAEGDGIPGLIVDVYGSAAVIQCHGLATHRLLDVWGEILSELYDPALETIYSKSSETLKGVEGEDLVENRFLRGDSCAVTVRENRLLFRVNFVDGQKTGFFVDQRDSRRLTSEVAKGKRVLNLFSYSGGFSIAALAGGASRVTSVDVSGPALRLLKENAALNNFDLPGEAVVENDCFRFLENDDERYDLIIVDPPPFAKSRSALERALQGYRAINNLALKRLDRNGAVLTFSCSQVVGRELFDQAVRDAGIETGRQLRIVHQLSSPLCHPVSLYHPEGAYLKGLYAISEN